MAASSLPEFKVSFAVNPSPRHIAISPDGQVFATSTDGKVLALSNGSVHSYQWTDHDVHGIVYNEVAHSAFVIDRDNNVVGEFCLEKDEVVKKDDRSGNFPSLSVFQLFFFLDFNLFIFNFNRVLSVS